MKSKVKTQNKIRQEQNWIKQYIMKKKMQTQIKVKQKQNG